MDALKHKSYYSEALAGLLAECTDIPVEELVGAVETPADPKMGHFAFPCFKLAKALKKAPPLIAKDLAERIMEKRSPWLSEAVATGPYVNFFLNRAEYAKDVLAKIRENGEKYGASDQGKGKTVVMDYSSPNIAKPLHVGHLGSTLIGKAIDNIYRFLGYNLVSINHLGDWGTQFGKLITAYLRWGSREEIEKTEIDGLVKLYVRFHDEAEKDASLNDEARAWVVKMQNGDEEGLALWRWFVDLSIREYNRSYKRMGISFDFMRGESYYTDMMDGVAKELTDKGLLKESEGARIVDLEEYKMPPCLILRGDGGTLYPTRDIAAAIDRYKEFKFDLCLYVTGNEQSLHFAQWMKVIELMGYPWAAGLVHISYGMSLFEGGKLSTRKGDVIKVEGLLDEAVSKTLAIIEEKNPNLADKETVAEQVGVGALTFNQLYTGRIKDTMFNWDRMLNFEGETGPYVQYTHARACSVMEKGGLSADAAPSALVDTEFLTDDESFEVLRVMNDFPSKVEEAAAKYEPFIIARQIMALSQAFNAFYHKHVILVDDIPVRTARLALTSAVRQVLKTGLNLLNIVAPQAM